MKLAPEVKIGGWIIRIVIFVVVMNFCLVALNQPDDGLVAAGFIGLLVLVLGNVYDIRRRISKKLAAINATKEKENNEE